MLKALPNLDQGLSDKAWPGCRASLSLSMLKARVRAGRRLSESLEAGLCKHLTEGIQEKVMPFIRRTV